MKDSLKICFRNQEDEFYKCLLTDLSEYFQQGIVTPFLGAGASFDSPSRLPMANSLTIPLVYALWSSVFDVLNKSKISQRDINFAYNKLESARLELLLDVLHQSYKQDALDYLSVLYSDRWNYNHASIATLAKAGMLSQCFTLNFDLLIEEAATCHGVLWQTHCPLNNGIFPDGVVSPQLTIIKPHGSFLPASEKSDPLVNLQATLSQVGSNPQPQNQTIFAETFRKCPVLLVGGYSDNDWDIFPIIAQQAKNLKHIIWVHYISNENIQKGEEPRGESDKSFHKHVKPMLQKCNADTTVVYCVLKDLFKDIISNHGLKTKPLPDPIPVLIPDASRFYCLNDDRINSQTIKTALSLSMLLQNTGSVDKQLLRWLLQQPQVLSNPSLMWQVEDLVAHSEHTSGRVYKAIPHTRRSIELRKLVSNRNDNNVADAMVWLGYEYLCLAKRPILKRPWLFLIWPWFVWKGERLLKSWGTVSYEQSSAGDNNSVQRSVMAEYYKVDLVHCWGNLLMIIGPVSIYILKPLFRWVNRRYNFIAKKSHLMDEVYYWLRHLEAQLLCGDFPKRANLEEKLNQIEQSYRLTQNIVQLGNVKAYRALLYYLYDKNRRRAGASLRRAYREWIRSGEELVSGQRRVRIFACFIGMWFVRMKPKGDQKRMILYKDAPSKEVLKKKWDMLEKKQ